jgi:hypothetical protein
MRKPGLSHIVTLSLLLAVQLGSAAAFSAMPCAMGGMHHTSIPSAAAADVSVPQAMPGGMHRNCCEGKRHPSNTTHACNACCACTAVSALPVSALVPLSLASQHAPIIPSGKSYQPYRQPPGVWRPPCLQS